MQIFIFTKAYETLPYAAVIKLLISGLDMATILGDWTEHYFNAARYYNVCWKSSSTWWWAHMLWTVML